MLPPGIPAESGGWPAGTTKQERVVPSGAANPAYGSLLALPALAFRAQEECAVGDDTIAGLEAGDDQ